MKFSTKLSTRRSLKIQSEVDGGDAHKRSFKKCVKVGVGGWVCSNFVTNC